jgi:hypothetical protein
MAPLCFHLLFQADEISLQSLNAGIVVSTLGDSNLPKRLGSANLLLIFRDMISSH